jgi:hypothetical protein
MRLCVPWTLAASARASWVLPVPGTSSSRRCPSESRHVRASRVTCSLPRIAFWTLATSESKVLANQATWSEETSP